MRLTVAEHIDIYRRLWRKRPDNTHKCLRVMHRMTVETYDEIVLLYACLSGRTVGHHLRDGDTWGIVLSLQANA